MESSGGVAITPVAAAVRVVEADAATSHEDLERIRVVLNARYIRDEGVLWRVPDRERAPQPLEAYFGPTTQNSLLIALMDDSRIVGTLLLQRGTRKDAPVKTFEFGMLVVEHEGRGHAKALIAHAEDMARGEGALRMELTVWMFTDTVLPAKERLIAMYTHLGYAVVERVALHDVNPTLAADTTGAVTVVRMRKPLTFLQNP